MSLCHQKRSARAIWAQFQPRMVQPSAAVNSYELGSGTRCSSQTIAVQISWPYHRKPLTRCLASSMASTVANPDPKAPVVFRPRDLLLPWVALLKLAPEVFLPYFKGRRPQWSCRFFFEGPVSEGRAQGAMGCFFDVLDGALNKLPVVCVWNKLHCFDLGNPMASS